ncbi:MAG: aspartyl protease family protein [Gemmatimonadota bacterium]|nr:aspartyl protease family protein [Gemmatimonadota bacterium]
MAARVRSLALLLLSAACGGGSAGRVATSQPTPAGQPSSAPVRTVRAAPADAVGRPVGFPVPAVFTRYHVFIRATIGGAPALLLFDSGASATIFSPRLVHRLGLAYRGRHVAFGIGEAVTDASLYEGAEIGIGPIRIKPATVLTWSDAGFPTYGRTVPDGVIGYDLLRALVIVVDVHAGRIVAFDTATPPEVISRGGQVVPLRITNGLPVIPLDLFVGGSDPTPASPAATPLSVVVDFGAGAGLQLSRVVSDRLGLRARLRETRTRQLVGIGGAVEVPEGTADSARIAGAAIPRVLVAADTSTVASVSLAEADGFVGTEILRRFAVTLDYARGRAVFEPNLALRAPFCRNAAGLCVRTETGLHGAQVFFVDPGSPGARAGIRPGNLIVAIDGTSVAQLAAAEVDRLLDRGPGSVLEVLRGAAQFRIPPRDAPTQRGPIPRRAQPRERVGELIRLPSP